MNATRNVAVLALLASIAGCSAAGPRPSMAAETGPRAGGLYPHEGGILKYRVLIRFGEENEAKAPSHAMPAGWKFGRVSGVSTDKDGNVYVAQRGTDADPVIVFDAKGTKMVASWGKGMFTKIHGLRVDPHGDVWITDVGDHRVWKFSPTGKVLLQLGEKGVPGNDQANHFNRPADIAFAPSGEVYIVEQGEDEEAQGMGNPRVVRLTQDGKYVGEWGSAGTGPGQFHFPHSIAIDSKGRVFVSDRENNRVQVFDAQGKFLKQWTHLGSIMSIVVAPDDQLWMLGDDDSVEILTYDSLAGRIMKVDPETGRILGSMPTPGHMLTLSPSGDIFVASITGNVFRFFKGWEVVQNGGTVPVPAP
jgi:DNA-binding beta-propeller fold protein YncE